MIVRYITATARIFDDGSVQVLDRGQQTASIVRGEIRRLVLPDHPLLDPLKYYATIYDRVRAIVAKSPGFSIEQDEEPQETDPNQAALLDF